MNPPVEHPLDGAENIRVPLFGTWRNAYRVVVAVLILDILLLYVGTRLFS